MYNKNLKTSFLKYCSDNGLKKNINQLATIDLLNKNFKKNNNFKNLFLNFFGKKNKKLGFYLHGDVGVGKTMILNFFYNNLNISKHRVHFNQFMINFHNFRHQNKQKNSIENFVKNIKKKYELIYFDEFQVTNIVDAMILGKLFEIIFQEKIKVIITSNSKINDLYKDGLQREQFLPFLNLIKINSIERKLVINEDYRKSTIRSLDRYFYPLNEDSYFKINQIFRKLTKGKKLSRKNISVRGRVFFIENYYEKVAKFNFDDLFKLNIGSEDFIKIAEVCNFIVIENIPLFSNENMDKQQRFITFIDIIYEKKIPLMISSKKNPENLGTSYKLTKPFKRTLSRLYELTSPNFSESLNFYND
jgi:cell division protein ZapE